MPLPFSLNKLILSRVDDERKWRGQECLFMLAKRVRGGIDIHHLDQKIFYKIGFWHVPLLEHSLLCLHRFISAADQYILEK